MDQIKSTYCLQQILFLHVLLQDADLSRDSHPHMEMSFKEEGTNEQNELMSVSLMKD